MGYKKLGCLSLAEFCVFFSTGYIACAKQMLMELLNKKVLRLMLTAKSCEKQTWTMKGEEKSMKYSIGGQRMENCC